MSGKKKTVLAQKSSKKKKKKSSCSLAQLKVHSSMHYFQKLCISNYLPYDKRSHCRWPCFTKSNREKNVKGGPPLTSSHPHAGSKVCSIQNEVCVGHLWKMCIRKALPSRSVFIKCANFMNKFLILNLPKSQRRNMGFLLVRSLFPIKRWGKINTELWMT